MSIVKMKKLRLLALRENEDALLKDLQSFGCLELSAPQPPSDSEALLSPSETKAAEKQAGAEKISAALKALDTYAYEKSPLFSLRPCLTEAQLFDDRLLRDAMEAADRITSLDDRIRQSIAQQTRIESAKTSLLPWTGLDIPLDFTGTSTVAADFGVLPATVSIDEINAALEAEIPEAQLFLSSSDREQHYLLLLVHKSLEEKAIALLRSYGWAAATLKGFTGTPDENIEKVSQAAVRYAEAQTSLIAELQGLSQYRDELKVAWERLTQELSRETARKELLNTGTCFYLEGWVTAPKIEKLEKLLWKYICAWELSDPQEGDDVPVLLKNSPLSEPMSMVTEMYSLPEYGSIDPNPLILPFFTMFFGIMYADMGYGLILLIGSLFITKRFKPAGGMGRMMRLGTLCGITTIFWGFLFGSFFGDAIPVLTGLLGFQQKELWSLIDPLEEPMTMLIGSLVLGAIHLLFGMAVNAYMLIRDGHPLDALFDVGSWWLLFAGIGIGAMGKGWIVCILGAAALILTQGRAKPTIPGKLIGGIASLYDITSYLGDLLSYTRLMALMLASSVIASVVNVLGSLSGSIIVFIVVFLVGHAFNMGINIIGTYVHAARLQFLEFFGKFYKEGGRAFAPLTYKTKYTEIIKEDN